MRLRGQELLRWTAILLCGGFGLWQLWGIGRSFLTGGPRDAFGSFFLLLLLAFALSLMAASLLIAYFAFRRQYRKLFYVLAVLGSIVVFVFLTDLPGLLGLYEYFDHHIRVHGGPPPRSAALLLAILVLPIAGTAGFFRLCRRLIEGKTAQPASRTRATRWLVVLGACLMLSSGLVVLVDMLLALDNLTTNPSLRLTFSLWDDYVVTMLVGSLLAILGLIRRQPIP